MTTGRMILVAALVLMIGAFFYWDLGAYLTLESLKAQQASLDALCRLDALLHQGL